MTNSIHRAGNSHSDLGASLPSGVTGSASSGAAPTAPVSRASSMDHQVGLADLSARRPSVHASEAGSSSTSPSSMPRVKLTASLSQKGLLDDFGERSDHFSLTSLTSSRFAELGSSRMALDVESVAGRGSSSDASEVVGQEAVVRIPNDVQIGEQLRQIFAPHVTDANRARFDALIADRAQTLHEMGETPGDIAAVLAKGGFRDYVAQATSGFVRSVPFGVASRLFDVEPVLTSFAKTPAQVGATVGGVSGAVDTLGGTVLTHATSDITWLSASREQLAPVMAEAKEAIRPSLTRLAAEVTGAFQAYTVRNVIRTGVAPLAEHALGAVGAANVDSWITAAGSPVAGGVAYLAMQYMNETNHRTGPEYLLGRTDWIDQYKALKHSGPADPLKNFALRAVHLPHDVATDLLGGLRDLFTGTNLIKNGAMLAGGFAASLTGKTAAAEAVAKAGYGAAAVSAVKQATNTVLSAPIFAGWTTADVVAGPVLDKVAQHVKELAHRIQVAGAPSPSASADHIAIDID